MKYRTLLESSKFIIHTFKNLKFQITIHYNFYNFQTLKHFLVEALYCKNSTRLQKSSTVKAILFLPRAIAATPPNGHIYSNQLKLKKLQLPGETLCRELEQLLNQPNMSVTKNH